MRREQRVDPECDFPSDYYLIDSVRANNISISLSFFCVLKYDGKGGPKVATSNHCQ
jgi:hypothetical protein